MRNNSMILSSLIFLAKQVIGPFMASWVFGIKPLLEAMMASCKLDPQSSEIWIKNQIFFLLIKYCLFNNKMPSYQYTNFNYKSKLIPLPSCLYNENPNPWEDALYINTEPWPQCVKLKFQMCFAWHVTRTNYKKQIAKLRQFVTKAWC